MRRFAILLFCCLTPLVACGAIRDHLLGPLHEGPHRIQATTAADLQRGVTLAACLQGWARANGHANADYTDVDYSRLVIVRVGGDGVIGTDGKGDTWQTHARENADTIFINEGVSNSEFVGLERHEFVHVTQSYHRELIGADGNIHWAPPFNACRVLLAVFGS